MVGINQETKLSRLPPPQGRHVQLQSSRVSQKHLQLQEIRY